MHAQTDGLTDGRTHDGHNAMTIARWPLASGAKNSNHKGGGGDLKKKSPFIDKRPVQLIEQEDHDGPVLLNWVHRSSTHLCNILHSWPV